MTESNFDKNIFILYALILTWSCHIIRSKPVCDAFNYRACCWNLIKILIHFDYTWSVKSRKMIKSFDLSVFEHAMNCRFFVLAMNRRLLSPPMFFLLVIRIKKLMKHYKHSKLKMKFASCRLIYAQRQVSIMLRLIKPSWASSLVLAYTHLILVSHFFLNVLFCVGYTHITT